MIAEVQAAFLKDLKVISKTKYLFEKTIVSKVEKVEEATIVAAAPI